MELEFDVSGKVQESTSIQAEEDEEQHSSEEVVHEQPQVQMLLLGDKEGRLDQLKKYSNYAELVAFALNIA